MARNTGSPSKLELTGQKYNRWLVLEKVAPTYWRCRCDCGQERVVSASSLRNGRSKSCGCYSTERKRTHNKTGSTIYGVWRGMHKRCYNPKSDQFHNYGARGIAVCDRWHAFANFYADMGDPPPGHSIDRIDNAGNYEPGNCRWVTQKEQIRNKRNTVFVEYEGRTVALAELCEQRGIPLRRTRNRLAAGFSVEEALSSSRHNAWSRGLR